MSRDYNDYHQPVLLAQVVDALALKPDGCYVDCTVGGGGHARAILDKLSGGRLIGLDRDEKALSAAGRRLSEGKKQADFELVHSRFSALSEVLLAIGIKGVDGILADLGISSRHVDSPERGFSYNRDGPLDMRMNDEDELTAAQIVNSWSQDRLSEIFFAYGEERYARQIARAIVDKRQQQQITSTVQLAEIISEALPAFARREKQHPAKRTFQAIRIAVNGELEELTALLEQGVHLLNDRGRICIISFHSLEDRLVKKAFRQWEDPCVCPREFPVCTCGQKSLGRAVSRKSIVADDEEKQINPRSRSARLRCFERHVD